MGALMSWHQFFGMVVNMIWFSYMDKLYIKMMGYPRKIEWNLHHHLKTKVNYKNDMVARFWSVFCSSGCAKSAQQLKTMVLPFLLLYFFLQYALHCYLNFKNNQQVPLFFRSFTPWYVKLRFTSNTFWTKIPKSNHSGG